MGFRFTNFKTALRRTKRLLPGALLLASLLAGTTGHAQTTPPAPTAAADAAGPLLTPAQFLGYALGSQFTPQADVLRYAAHVVAHAPGRMRITRYGQTYESRSASRRTDSGSSIRSWAR